MSTTVNVQELEAKVKDMYRHVAEEPHGDYHFELGRGLAERLGYPADVLAGIPESAVESFAGVGYFFDLAELGGRERDRSRQRLRHGRLLRRSCGRIRGARGWRRLHRRAAREG